jgi:hypothetical protein
MGELAKSDVHDVSDQSADENAAILSMIERAARDPNVDVDKMERLFNMRERMAEQSARSSYAAAMAAVQAALPVVVRRAENKQTSSKYAKLEHIASAIKPIYTQHGFSLSFGTEDCRNDSERRIVCTCRHRAGHSEKHTVDVPFDNAGIAGKVNKTNTHAYKSTLTYGRSMLTCMIFDVQTSADDDGNAAGAGRVISNEQCALLVAEFEAVSANIARFCEHYRIDKYADLPAAKFDEAMAMLKAKKGKSNG